MINNRLARGEKSCSGQSVQPFLWPAFNRDLQNPSEKEWLEFTLIGPLQLTVHVVQNCHALE